IGDKADAKRDPERRHRVARSPDREERQRRSTDVEREGAGAQRGGGPSAEYIEGSEQIEQQGTGMVPAELRIRAKQLPEPRVVDDVQLENRTIGKRENRFSRPRKGDRQHHDDRAACRHRLSSRQFKPIDRSAKPARLSRSAKASRYISLISRRSRWW